ncbi:MAG TPA: DNA primase [Burkholderiaceae bacterium]|nr:DNA primase [Burkholderiaceae bacterium]
MIPQGFIQDLLARVDIVDVVGRHVRLKKAGQNYLGLCPFHGEKTPSFTVSPSKQFFHCFGCGAHGSAVGFLMDLRGLPYVEAVRELAQQAGITVPEVSADSAAQARTSITNALVEVLQQAADFYKRKLKSAPLAIDYLKGRGLTGRTAARYGLGYSPDAWQALREAFPEYEDPRLVEAGLVLVGEEGKRYDRFRGRVMFPIRNRRGGVIGFGARIIESGEPKYLNSPETPVFRKGLELYGLFEANEAIRRKRRVIVCEGYMDVIQLAQAGFEESVAALGTAITSHHVSVLFRLTDHVIFAFDGDAAGRKAARRALEATLPIIGEAKRASFVMLPASEDPDSLIRAHGPPAFEDEIARALPLSRWLVQALSDGRDLKQAEDRAALLAEAKPLLETMSAGALRLQLLQELAQASGTPAADVESYFGLKPWRRLPSGRPGGRAPAKSAPVDDLRLQILKRLLAFPALARDFNAQIAAEFLEGDDPVDHQITEVWRSATAGTGDPTSGALIEALGESEHAAVFRELVTQNLALEDDLEATRADLSGAFAKLELRRTQDELATLVQGTPTNETLERIRELSERQARLKDGMAAPDSAQLR